MVLTSHPLLFKLLPVGIALRRVEWPERHVSGQFGSGQYRPAGTDCASVERAGKFQIDKRARIVNAVLIVHRAAKLNNYVLPNLRTT